MYCGLKMRIVGLFISIWNKETSWDKDFVKISKIRFGIHGSRTHSELD